MKSEYRSGAVNRHALLSIEGQHPYTYTLGCVPTPHGYVEVYSEKEYARFSFIIDSVQHELVRRDGDFTKRGLVRIARSFVRDVVSE